MLLKLIKFKFSYKVVCFMNKFCAQKATFKNIKKNPFAIKSVSQKYMINTFKLRFHSIRRRQRNYKTAPYFEIVQGSNFKKVVCI